MSAPKLEDLPKVAVDLKTQLEEFSPDKLKDTVTQEKIVLPTAEGKHLIVFPFKINFRSKAFANLFKFRCGHRKVATRPNPWY